MNCYASYQKRVKKELMQEYINYGCVAGCEYIYSTDGRVFVIFSDNIRGYQFVREYKNKSIAKREATKFLRYYSR